MSSPSPRFRSHDLVSGATLPLNEPKAATVGNFDNYSFNRKIDGSMELRVYNGLSFFPVNMPSLALVAVVDLILRNKSLFAYGFYVVGGNVGIWAQGPLLGATAADGTPIHSFQFRRLSDGSHEIWLAYDDSSIHGGPNLPWELSIQVLQAACTPASSTLKVIASKNGGPLIVSGSSYHLVQ
jgi:hypothetical protein